jgi:uncharacterized BrkB/YihY/UPF0761 family membrane protein
MLLAPHSSPLHSITLEVVGFLRSFIWAYNPAMTSLDHVWSWYIHLHLPQRIGLGIIASVIGLAVAAFFIYVLFAWFYALITGRRRGWVSLLVGAILAVILMAAGVPLNFCLLVGFILMPCTAFLWDLFGLYDG